MLAYLLGSNPNWRWRSTEQKRIHMQRLEPTGMAKAGKALSHALHTSCRLPSSSSICRSRSQTDHTACMRETPLLHKLSTLLSAALGTSTIVERSCFACSLPNRSAPLPLNCHARGVLWTCVKRPAVSMP